MANSLYSRYVWLIDTIRRRRRITRSELDRAWRQTSFGNGNPLCRRTLYNYRNAIAELFGINIQVDASTYEYYIAEEDENNRSVTNWLLNTGAVNDALAGARDISDRIFVDDIPSAREHLGTVIQAIRQSLRLTFDYQNYSRSRPTQGIVYEPYFLKIFKLRWYVVGRNVRENKIKTYALDRMRDAALGQPFAMPDDLRPDEYFRDSFGIVVTQSPAKRIAIRADHRNANYLRGLPLHRSQQEVVHDGFSIFYYKMRITDDLVQELLGYGPRLTVLEPPELRAIITSNMRESLKNYEETSRTNSPTRPK